MSKYKVPVYIETTVSKHIGEVECDNIEEFHDEAEKLWKSTGYSVPAVYECNDFDLGDFDIMNIDAEDLKCYE